MCLTILECLIKQIVKSPVVSRKKFCRCYPVFVLWFSSILATDCFFQFTSIFSGIQYFHRISFFTILNIFFYSVNHFTVILIFPWFEYKRLFLFPRPGYPINDIIIFCHLFLFREIPSVKSFKITVAVTGYINHCKSPLPCTCMLNPKNSYQICFNLLL